MNSSDDDDDLEYNGYPEPEVSETLGGCVPVVALCVAFWVLAVVVVVKCF